MPAKIHGLIVTDAEGKLLVDSYNSVLLFKNEKDAESYIPIGGKVHQVVTARISRKKTK